MADLLATRRNMGGPLTKVLYFIAALIGATLPLTGYYLWMKKKKII